ncbi:hypothetical protein LS71_001630 [Helicobacter jaachi]|uniref:Uncharacterized protein n=2 Tax=Helicobacter jaachi TaxID=1677920 RepID=A0A4U8TFK6_9HELI|nr:hypothetical protein LS71_001630 [Helicobacter jaachi]
MTTASYILASFAGLLLCFTLYQRLKLKIIESSPTTSRTIESSVPKRPITKHFATFLSTFKHFGALEYTLLAIIALWVSAAILDMGSGRAQYCGDFHLSNGLAYATHSLQSTTSGFKILCLLCFAIALFVAFRDKKYRVLLYGGVIWLVLMLIFYTLVVSKCGAKYYLMSGFYLSVLCVMCVWVSIIIAKSRTLGYLSLCFTLIAALQSSNYYKERPRVAYHHIKSYSSAWVAQAQAFDKALDSKKAASHSADSIITESSGTPSAQSIESSTQNKPTKPTLTITIPASFPHWRWESWFFPGFTHTLRVYGLIKNDFDIIFMPEPAP